MIHLLYTPFTGLGWHQGFRGDKWYHHRIELFKEFTLLSLLNQTNKNFIHWISFRPEEKYHQLTKELEDHLKSINYPYIFTFGGLCFWDDKYFNDNLLERLKATLPELKDTVGDNDYVLKTIVPSDDMYLKDAVELIQQQDYQNNEALTFHNGYVMKASTGEVAYWNPPPVNTPPFYTLIFPKDVFLDPQKHFSFVEKLKSHEKITQFEHEEVEGRHYCVLVHNMNISTAWNNRNKGRGKINKEEIIKNLGL